MLGQLAHGFHFASCGLIAFFLHKLKLEIVVKRGHGPEAVNHDCQLFGVISLASVHSSYAFNLILHSFEKGTIYEVAPLSICDTSFKSIMQLNILCDSQALI